MLDAIGLTGVFEALVEITPTTSANLSGHIKLLYLLERKNCKKPKKTLQIKILANVSLEFLVNAILNERQTFLTNKVLYSKVF